ncbi:MAG TPA: TetR/AcrR family transcriptional regulator [Stackebrandtia sp.]|jgi:AcrR family transcriptional regulator|uniref:TetR/AcrR family transcriptional regulator n=1 Tax=Stackebrandtia sp. TaxID=2023065 RepID=UPI002D360321|nr:TetR/AcrR family transcriptional regulator [Stackebrandtia sp.]HZE38292.1 TetR/AcrR family transcriptional regulator [Stackebrandtia sp.]
MDASPDTPTADRRERKKAATRQRIADVATMMFGERGFDAVTVNEIAEAADVSKVTVFNHFARKEDMFFDRMPQARELLAQTIKTRPKGRTVVWAVRRMVQTHIKEQHPLLGLRERYSGFWQVVADSRALQVRARELGDEIEALLAELILAEGQVDERHARLTAGWIMTAIRTGLLTAVARVMADDPIEAINKDYAAFMKRSLIAVEFAAKLA